MTQHVTPDFALLVAALDHDDPERCAAWAHARQCARCKQLLEQGEAVLGLIDAEQPEQFVDPSLKQRILDSVARLAPERRRARWQPLGLVAGALASVALAALDGQERVGWHAAKGLHCVFWEVLFALLPLALAAQFALSVIKRRASWSLSLAGMFGALAGQVWLRARCPLQDVNPHLFMFHCGGVALAALAGMVIARAIHPLG